jgi:AhpD family alkylhydroperoxidase
MTPIRIAYAKVTPGAAQAMYAANSYFDGCCLPQLLRRLIELRVSQINGCSSCIWLHFRLIKELGEAGECLRPSNIGALHYASAMPRELRWSGLNSSRDLRTARRLTPHSQRYAITLTIGRSWI